MKKSTKNRNIYYYLGNIILLFSLLGFVYIIYPLFTIYAFPPKILQSLPETGTYITIPKISAQSIITENVDPFNTSEYHNVLKKSVAHAKGTSLPGENGTIFLFAHSSGSPWDQTHHNTIFLRLSELTVDDKIEIKRNGKIYKYKVYAKKEVNPYDIGYLLQRRTNQLILQTCTPVGTDWKRLLVFALPTE